MLGFISQASSSPTLKMNTDSMSLAQVGTLWREAYRTDRFRQTNSDIPLAEIGLSTLNGENGFELIGEAIREYSGWSVSGAGDVNGDGIDDVIIGAPYADSLHGSDSGKSYVIFGSKSGFNPTVSLSKLNGRNGFVLLGEAANDGLGQSVSGAGDINGDGIDDVIIGAPYADSLDSFRLGKSYVVFGSVSGFEASFALSSLNGSNGFVLLGETGNSRSGQSVSNAGDVNGDGIDDVIIGAPYAGVDSGRSYVVFGSVSGFEASFALSSLNGSNGFVLLGETNSKSGWSVSGAGDVNGDGIDDVIIGAPYADTNSVDSGESYAVFGSASGFKAAFALSSLNGDNGFMLLGEARRDYSGWSVSGAGDMNGDGIDDVIVGAPDDRFGVELGRSYVVFGSSSGFESSLFLSQLDSNNGFMLLGEVANDRLGWSVGGAGDVNGDGIDDVIIGAPYADPSGISSAGKSYVVFGSKSGFEVSFALSSLNGRNGFVLTGQAKDGHSGWSVSGAGDMNGDGVDDVVIGAPDYRYGSEPGKGYVVLGELIQTPPPNFLLTEIDLSSLDGGNGFELTGEEAKDRSGYSVSGAGDVNGDGIDDVIIGAPYADPNGISSAGKSYVVFGSTSSFNPTLALSSLTGKNGFMLIGETTDDRSGWSVSGVGDVNGDGVDDIIIGAPYVNEISGKTYVVFGSTLGFESSLNLSDLNGGNGFVLLGEATYDHLGWSVSGAGDVNNDGIDDLIIGAPYNDANFAVSGKSYVIFGGKSDFEVSLVLSSLNGSNGFALVGESSYRSGWSVSSAGDVNGDGIDDVIIGAPYANEHQPWLGKSYVVFGSTLDFEASLTLSNLNGSNGFVLVGEAASDCSGWSVSGAGDVNGDGVDDVIIGAPYADPNGSRSGKSYVVFGSKLDFEASLDLSNLNGSNGFMLVGEAAGDRAGYSVSGAGDMNGDGIDDIIIGAPDADPNARSSGKNYVIFGNNVTNFGRIFDLSSLYGSNNGFVLTGELAGDRSGWSVSGVGDINQDGFADVIVGAPDADGLNDSLSGKSYIAFGKLIQIPLIPSGWSLFDVALPILVAGAISGTALVGVIAKFGIWDQCISHKSEETSLSDETEPLTLP